MQAEVRGILEAAARRLRATRALEAAAAGAIAAGLCAAAVEAAWIAAPWSPSLAAGLCLLAVSAGAAPLATPRLRVALRLSGPETRLVGAICLVAGLAGLASVLGGWQDAAPKLLVPLLFLPVGAAAGAAGSLAHGATATEAAVYHDLRLGLAERLGTAAELAASNAPPVGFARCVYAQALRAARAARPQHRPVWRRTRATLGALGLAIGLCAVLAAVPAPRLVDVRGSFQRIQSRAERLTPADRKQVLRALRRLAEQVERDPRLLAALKAAAIAAADAPQELPDRLRELEGAVANADDAEAAAIAKALLEAMGLPTDGEARGDGPGRRAVAGDANRPTGDANRVQTRPAALPLAARTHVWHPDYAAPGDANAPAPADPNAAGAFVPLRTAWSAARARARSALAAGRVPPEYRTLVRRFFELE